MTEEKVMEQIILFSDSYRVFWRKGYVGVVVLGTYDLFGFSVLNVFCSKHKFKVQSSYFLLKHFVFDVRDQFCDRNRFVVICRE